MYLISEDSLSCSHCSTVSRRKFYSRTIEEYPVLCHISITPLLSSLPTEGVGEEVRECKSNNKVVTGHWPGPGSNEMNYNDQKTDR